MPSLSAKSENRKIKRQKQLIKMFNKYCFFHTIYPNNQPNFTIDKLGFMPTIWLNDTSHYQQIYLFFHSKKNISNARSSVSLVSENLKLEDWTVKNKTGNREVSNTDLLLKVKSGGRIPENAFRRPIISSTKASLIVSSDSNPLHL